MAATAAVERAQACDLCGGDAFELVSQRDRDGAPLETCICARCGLVVHREPPGSDELAAYYAGPYREQYQHEQTPSARRVLRSWEKGPKLLRPKGRMRTVSPKSGRLGSSKSNGT